MPTNEQRVIEVLGKLVDSWSDDTSIPLEAFLAPAVARAIEAACYEEEDDFGLPMDRAPKLRRAAALAALEGK